MPSNVRYPAVICACGSRHILTFTQEGIICACGQIITANRRAANLWTERRKLAYVGALMATVHYSGGTTREHFLHRPDDDGVIL